MNAKTAELLYILLSGADRLMRPTFCNLTDSFEGWACRKGFLSELHRLERRDLLEKEGVAGAGLAYRLTEQGRVLALGGRDPLRQWNRGWDGKWRLVMFDVPENRNATRARLRRGLRERWFGCLHKSVWVSPDPLDDEVKRWSSLGEDVGCILCLDARPSAGEPDNAIVAAAWDLERINRLYERCLSVLAQLPDRNLTESRAAAQVRLHRWARPEQAAWLDAMSVDPLLPSALLPDAYLGKQVWQRRAEVLKRAKELIS
jgi:phenylacetic acid degradation operon negative regulatory protein